MKIKVWRDPYDTGVNLTRPKEIEINPGLTILVGCNGSGKTTLLRNIEDELKLNHIPVKLWDNQHDGGFSSISQMLSGFGRGEDTSLGIALWSSSEGEAIKLNLINQTKFYKDFITDGYYKDKEYKFVHIFFNEENKAVATNQRWLLFDATDSGMSIDNVIEVKEFFHSLINETQEELYIVISANEYEMCDGEACFDVNSGKYLRFTDYNDYKKFIICSRKNKEKRLAKQEIISKKRHEKALAKYEELKEKYNVLKNKLLTKHNCSKLSEIKYSYSEFRDIDDLKSKIHDFCRENCIEEDKSIYE